MNSLYAKNALLNRHDDSHFGVLNRPKGGCQSSPLREYSPTMLQALAAAPIAFSHGLSSVERPSREGVSGAYLIRDNTRRVPLAVFKPCDEEVVDTLDPVLSDFEPGMGAFREVAAYLLDKQSFAGVPETSMARVQSRPVAKEGMLQVFVQNSGDADDFGPSLFRTEDVQRIAAFDLRVMNADRHGGNLLVSQEGSVHRLTPIDHGLILPESLRSLPWPVWMNWPQSKEPMTPRVREYIMGLNFDKDAKMLRSKFGNNISEGALDALQCGTMLLKACVSLNMTLYEIGLLVYSTSTEEKSFLGSLFEETKDLDLGSLINLDGSLGNECLAALNRTLAKFPKLFTVLSDDFLAYT
eukprot:Plantae.Rhodophyta-Purpureofilum_apyrenoidigerum.ctg5803.p1 GENE.Plantae.Rhodophyta-Purpureofilum_apyrenoidigerum.ctg5803~~Plantae.Rhodophyta-Purpureofilum_apyrenoidigerum.ctg5803.p1  ORF type:complete len:354 (+),score=54.47 Plantae.Rhodophyta-Purpureofilum_apyrenoidigerum.ctg5803:533-1594(+)